MWVELMGLQLRDCIACSSALYLCQRPSIIVLESSNMGSKMWPLPAELMHQFSSPKLY